MFKQLKEYFKRTLKQRAKWNNFSHSKEWILTPIKGTAEEKLGQGCWKYQTQKAKLKPHGNLDQQNGPVGSRAWGLEDTGLDQTVKINEELSKRQTEHVKALEHHENTTSELWTKYYAKSIKRFSLQIHYFMCVGIFPVYPCIVYLVLIEPRRGHWIWNWSYREFESPMWILEIKFWSTRKEASALKV